jgi:hypothetical protein
MFYAAMGGAASLSSWELQSAIELQPEYRHSGKEMSLEEVKYS